MSNLRPFQLAMENDIYVAWDQGAKVVMPVLPTGGGKTVVVGAVAGKYDGGGVAIAHRQELIGQLSIQLAREGVYHDLLAPPKTNLRRKLSDLHLKKIGKNYINSRSKWFVGGVDTIVNMENDPRFDKIGMVVQDEGHHVLKTNKWGRAWYMFPNARYCLLPTASPRRADGAGLGAHAQGIVDVLLEGPSMRALIQQGYLTDYQLLCPKTQDLDMSGVHVSAATGDWNQNEVRTAVRKSKKIVGDVVRHYLEYARGKLGITFAVDVEEATKIADAFRQAGVPAQVVSAKTPDDLRRDILERFERREILQLVNVDLFGEGFDLPAVEVVSMARPTKSWALFAQQFGRALRLMITKLQADMWGTFNDATRLQLIRESLKPFALIIDHVGNVFEHKFPDRPQTWSLDNREKRVKGAPLDAIPLRACLNVKCLKAYERSEVKCPYCGTVPPLPSVRGGPEFVDGDLQLLTEDILAKMRGDVAYVDGQAYLPKGVPQFAAGTIIANHVARQHAQNSLRDTIAQWAGKHNQYEERVLHKRFYLTFGTTVAEAKVLKSAEAKNLQEKILLTI